MDFKYRLLESGEIRLLKPLSQSTGDLSFKVVHVPLGSAPSYAALSYTWGPPSNTYKVLLDGKLFSIRQTLNDALQQIHSSKLVHRYLWIDAICINQDSGDEKTAQVQLMRQIYEQAEKVLVWLGKPQNEEDNRLAFRKMDYFAKSLRRVVIKGRPLRPWWWPRKLRTVGDDLADFSLAISTAKDKSFFDVPGSETYRAWLGITSLWKSRYWTRCWVLQESTVPEKTTSVFLSGIAVFPSLTKVAFWCGDQQTTWSALNAAHEVAATLMRTPSINTTFISDALGSSSKLVRFREYRLVHNMPSFLEIMQMFRHTECDDPRDKVYAPLCLAPDNVRQHIRSDYNKTALEAYSAVVQYYLAQPVDKLDFIGNVLYREETQTVRTSEGFKSVLPSWVPNYSASVQIVPIPKILYVPERQPQRAVTLYDKRGVPTANPNLAPVFSPLDGYPCNASIQDNKFILSGAFIDVLKDKISSEGPNVEAIRSAAREKGFQWAVQMGGKYFTGESTGDAMNRTVVLDLRYDELRRPSERGGKQDTVFLHKPSAELSPAEFQFQKSMRVARTNAMTMRDIGFSKGHCYLMVPRTAREEDEVWALCGGKVLYILRAVDRGLKQYLLIGECYAHGLMDGEVVRRLHSGKLKLEDIALV